MNLPCKILASFLLICNFSTTGGVLAEEKTVFGILGSNIDLAIPDARLNASIDDIRWYMGQGKIGRLSQGKVIYLLNGTYDILPKGTLKIKNLTRNSGNKYKVELFDTAGKHVWEQKIDLQIQEMVSKPRFKKECTNTTLICEVEEGSDLELKLYVNGKNVKTSQQKVITYKWTTLTNSSFNCTARNEVSEKTSVISISCSEPGMDIYLISSIIGGSIILLIFLSLLIFYISKRKKQSNRRNDEELEIRAHGVTTEERIQKAHQIPGSTSQKPAVSQPPPPPSHRSQAPGHRPLPPGHRGHHQQQRRPPPPPLSTQAHQQKGPPLPRPRVQQKPPAGARENS